MCRVYFMQSRMAAEVPSTQQGARAMKKILSAVVVGVVGAILLAPAAHAAPSYCSELDKSSERISCHQACDVLDNEDLCQLWEMVYDMENGD
jgi:hypothetical protein